MFGWRFSPFASGVLDVWTETDLFSHIIILLSRKTEVAREDRGAWERNPLFRFPKSRGLLFSHGGPAGKSRTVSNVHSAVGLPHPRLLIPPSECRPPGLSSGTKKNVACRLHWPSCSC